MGQFFALLTQLGVNESFWVMLVIFIVTYGILHLLLTGPMSNLLVERDKRITGRQNEVTKIRIELVDIQEKLALERRRAQNEASSKFAQLRTQAVLEQRKILAEAREQFAGQVKVARDQAEKMLSDERQKLDRMSADLKEEIVSKLLGTSAAKNVSVGKEI